MQEAGRAEAAAPPTQVVGRETQAGGVADRLGTDAETWVLGEVSADCRDPIYFHLGCLLPLCRPPGPVSRLWRFEFAEMSRRSKGEREGGAG